jgi:hypothetical protein
VQDTKINVDDMFKDLHKFSEKEKKSGIKTSISVDFINHRSMGIS